MDFLTSELASSASYSDSVNNFLVRSEAADSSILTKWKQPLVAVSCNGTLWYPLLGNDMPFSFRDSFHGNFTTDVDFVQLLDLPHVTWPRNETETFRPGPIFLDLRDVVPAPISASILFTHEAVLSNSPEDSAVFDAHLCIIQARWVDSEIWISDQSYPAVLADIGMSTDQIVPYLQRTSSLENVIKMHPGWLKNIGVPYDDQNTTSSNPGLRQAFKACINGPGVTGSSCLSSFLAIYLTDALSYLRIDPLEHEGEYSDSRKSDDVILKQTFYKHAYAYSFQESTSIPLALAVMLLHVAITLIHTGIILFSSTPWYSSGWGSFGQLMALALRSRAAEGLQNVGAGAQSSQTWKEIVSVREAVDEKRLEMVVGDPEDQEAGGHYRLMRHAEPAKKYS